MFWKVDNGRRVSTVHKATVSELLKYEQINVRKLLNREVETLMTGLV